MRTLVVGAKGYLGSRFFARYPNATGTYHRPDNQYVQFDLSSFQRVDFEGYSYALLLGGIFNPVMCEREPQKTHFINVSQTLKLAQELFDRGTTPIFFSSDYALGGENQYGREKKELEERALELFGGNCLIIRCTKIYGTTKGDGTLFCGIAQALAENRSQSAASDQILAPLHVDDLVEGVVKLQQEGERGIFNAAGPDKISRYEAAIALAKLMRRSENLVTSISLDDIKDGVKRPKNSLLPSSIKGRPLQESLQEIARIYA